jgi:hypothetical protein
MLRGGFVVPKWDWFHNGKLTGEVLVGDFVGFGFGCSSILGIVDLFVMRLGLRYWLMSSYLAKEFQFGT